MLAGGAGAYGQNRGVEIPGMKYRGVAAVGRAKAMKGAMLDAAPVLFRGAGGAEGEAEDALVRGGALEGAREGPAEAARLGALLVTRVEAAEVARHVVRLLVGGGAAVAASSLSAARLRLLLAGGSGAGGILREAAQPARFGGDGGAWVAEAAMSAGTTDTSRDIARFLDGGRVVVLLSSSSVARFRLPLLGAATSSKNVRGLRTHFPRPFASVAARSSTMSMTSSLGILDWAAGRLAATGDSSATGTPGDRAADAATTPSGEGCSDACPVSPLFLLSLSKFPKSSLSRSLASSTRSQRLAAINNLGRWFSAESPVCCSKLALLWIRAHSFCRSKIVSRPFCMADWRASVDMSSGFSRAAINSKGCWFISVDIFGICRLSDM